MTASGSGAIEIDAALGNDSRAEKLIGLATSQRSPILVPAQSNNGESL